MTRLKPEPLDHYSSGALERLPLFPSKHVAPRNIDILLPPSYAKSPSRRYPVVYMHDGQNLFIPELSFIGVDWGVDELYYGANADLTLPEAIIVGIWNSPKRSNEYIAEKAIGEIKALESAVLTIRFGAPLGDRYLEFLVQELKPAIDSLYRTEPGRASTFVAGSSMGGISSLYALCQYPDVFGGAGCVSTHWPALGQALLDYMESNLPATGSHRIWFDHGTETLDSEYAPFQKKADVIMAKKGYVSSKDWVTRVYPGEEHSERAWRKRIGDVLTFLLNKPA